MLEPYPEDVRRINLGTANSRLESCVTKQVIVYGVLKKAYTLYQENKKEEIANFHESQISWRTQDYTTRSIASRYVNDLDFFINSGPEVLWLTVGKDVLYWGRAGGKINIIGEYTEDNPNAKEDREAYIIAKTMIDGWHDCSLDGERLDLWKMHPKAKDWLIQRGTIGRLNTKDYFIACIEGRDLSPWHEKEDMTSAAAMTGWRPNQKIPEIPRDWGFEVGRMAKTIVTTAANATGEEVTRITKVKKTSLSETEWQLALRKLLLEQNYRCAITRQKLEVTKEENNHWLAPSADRIDSNGHYTPDNVQIVSKAANRAKSDISPDETPHFFQALQFARENAE